MAQKKKNFLTAYHVFVWNMLIAMQKSNDLHIFAFERARSEFIIKDIEQMRQKIVLILVKGLINTLFVNKSPKE